MRYFIDGPAANKGGNIKAVAAGDRQRQTELRWPSIAADRDSMGSKSVPEIRLPYGVDELDPSVVAHADDLNLIRCFVRGCSHFVRRPTQNRRGTACPDHGIYCHHSRNRSTYTYDDVRLSVEPKADESFGSRIIARRARGEATPGSRIPERVDRLVTALFGQMTSEVAKVRYRLCHAIGSTLVDAHRYGFRRAVVLVHEFHSSTCKATKLEGNHRDLQDFIRLLPRSDHSVKTQSQLAAPFIVGPFHATGDPPERAAEEFFLPPDIPLFIGNLVTTLS
jgi:hypothetical protein